MRMRAYMPTTSCGAMNKTDPFNEAHKALSTLRAPTSTSVSKMHGHGVPEWSSRIPRNTSTGTRENPTRGLCVGIVCAVIDGWCLW